VIIGGLIMSVGWIIGVLIMGDEVKDSSIWKEVEMVELVMSVGWIIGDEVKDSSM